jgi:hypothetical protein
MDCRYSDYLQHMLQTSLHLQNGEGMGTVLAPAVALTHAAKCAKPHWRAHSWGNQTLSLSSSHSNRHALVVLPPLPLSPRPCRSLRRELPLLSPGAAPQAASIWREEGARAEWASPLRRAPTAGPFLHTLRRRDPVDSRAVQAGTARRLELGDVDLPPLSFDPAAAARRWIRGEKRHTEEEHPGDGVPVDPRPAPFPHLRRRAEQSSEPGRRRPPLSLTRIVEPSRAASCRVPSSVGRRSRSGSREVNAAAGLLHCCGL